MSAVISFTVFLICLLVLMATRTPVAVALSMVTVAGTAIFVSPSALSQLATSAYSLSSNSILVVVPMFILLANIRWRVAFMTIAVTSAMFYALALASGL